MRHIYTREQFKTAIDHGELADDYALVKHTTGRFKKVDDAAYTLELIVSTSDVDADKDTIDQKGWDLKRYKDNPVVLFGHDHSAPPIARAKKIWMENGVLRAVDEFMIGEEFGEAGKFAASVYAMYEKGFMSAFSVGFLPKEFEFNSKRGGFDFSAQEMIEHSAVPVPSNPNALVQARSAGIDMAPLKSYFVKLLDCGLFVPGEIESMYKQVKTHESVQVPKDIENAEVDGVEESVEDQTLEVDAAEEGAETETLEDENAEIESGVIESTESAGEESEDVEDDEINPIDAFKSATDALLTELRGVSAKLEILINNNAEPAPAKPTLSDDELKAYKKRLKEAIRAEVEIRTTGVLPE